MVNTNYEKTQVTDLTNAVSNYSVSAVTTDGVNEAGETKWNNDKWSQQLGYYKQIPELKKAIDALATWTCGKGYETDSRTFAELDRIRGWGEDTFASIMWNMIVTKKISGDAFAEIVTNEKRDLLNIKPLDPSTISTIVNDKGIVVRYEQESKVPGKAPRKFSPQDIFHITNDRVADEIHGTSIIDSCTAVILARNEAMTDYRRVLHRNVVPFRIIEIDSDNPTKIAQLKTQYQEAINKGEVLIIPKGNVEIADSTPSIQNPIEWIRYLENFFYQAVGVPRVIATSEGFTESGGKVGFLTFEPIYTWEQTQLEADLWNQLAIKVKFNRPPSLTGALNKDEKKDPAAFQPNDVTAGVGQ